MPTMVSCPSCGRSVAANAVDCEYCGANLALAALLAERQLAIMPQVSVDGPITPEILVPRLGEYLIERGVLSQVDLQKALDYQASHLADGTPHLIGQALLDLKLVDREVLDQVVTEQILQLQTALQRANRDLEERVRQRTIELERALNRLAELNQLKSNFIANISHELRTPLTHIKGYLELLLDDGLGPINQQQSEALAVMLRSEERLERLIENLIQFSLVARGDLSLQLTNFDIGQVFEEVVMEYIPVCKNKGISLQANTARQMPFVRADRQKITWVLAQLIDNAVKFTPSGGRVQLGIRESEKWVSIFVFDTGIGISSEQIDEIFEPFHQLDSSATRRYGGTGLGLAMVRKIIETHGSQVVVKSKEGQGSYFEFQLPVVKR
ncbi:MAG: zinc-ribbon domain-containing protein [Anaerolineales bacterium]|nr:zinc-ribbon domain-containing protein [Anaerolineales bacterium]